MEPNSTATRQVRVVLDLTCIHSFIGYSRLQQALRAHRDAGGRAEVVFLPFQVSPDASTAGEPLFDVHERHFGPDMARAIAGDTSFGADFGLTVDFGNAVHVNTFEAHRLLAAASRQGRGEAMAERLFRAYLSEGLNIGDGPTLARLAAETGVTPPDGGEADLRAELARVRGTGVRSVPQFLFEGGPVLSGSAPSRDDYLTALTAAPARRH